MKRENGCVQGAMKGYTAFQKLDEKCAGSGVRWIKTWQAGLHKQMERGKYWLIWLSREVTQMDFILSNFKPS